MKIRKLPFVSTDPEDLLVYGFDASKQEGTPYALALPASTQDLVELTRLAYEDGLPLIPRGAGTGMVGGVVPRAPSTVIVSLEKMNRILEVDTTNHVAVVEAGVINGRFQRALKDKGFFYPPDPASLNFCTIGGNVATGAGGPRAIKYGVTRDYVLGLELVLPDGSVTHTGVRTPKGVVGYDLTRLIVGSEGTLAFVTRVILKILPEPENIVTLTAHFESAQSAALAVSAILSSGVVPRTLEFMDHHSLSAVERYRPSGLPVNGALLLIELDGPAYIVTPDTEQVKEICAEIGGRISIARTSTAAEKLWEARRSISPALYSLRPSKINEDIVVPRSRIPEMLKRLDALSDESGILIANFGHAGDGNIHVNIMTDQKDPEEYGRARALVDKVFAHTLELGGTISGEHGVGLSKKPYLSMELDQVSISLMKHIKKVFDPAGIMNPGKIFPD